VTTPEKLDDVQPDTQSKELPGFQVISGIYQGHWFSS
jgi:hypothetical protein